MIFSSLLILFIIKVSFIISASRGAAARKDTVECRIHKGKVGSPVSLRHGYGKQRENTKAESELPQESVRERFGVFVLGL